MQTVLVTGGGGYIGSHAVKKLLKGGFAVVVVDNFSSGFREPLETLRKYGDLTVIEADLRDRAAIDRVFKEKNIDAVMHFAALVSVDESMRNPELYFDNNVIGSFNLLTSMRAHGVKKLIFSSTCAVYGDPLKLPVSETHPLNPTSPYGEFKIIVENLIKGYGKLHNFSYFIFRYYNVCGADEEGEIGDRKKPTALVQSAVRAALGIDKFFLTYSPVPTADGSPIRDYVNVNDLVDAHILGLEKILLPEQTSEIINLGTGNGYSVLQVISAVEEICNVKLPREAAKEARQGESGRIFADTVYAKKVLGWSPKTDIKTSILQMKGWYERMS